MTRRRLAVAAVLAAALAVIAVVLLTGGEKRRSARPPADRLAAALAYVPPSSELVMELDAAPGTQQRGALSALVQRFPAARFGAQAVRDGVGSIGLDADADLPALIGGPLIVAGPVSAVRAFLADARSLSPDLGLLLRGGAVVSTTAPKADDALATVSARLRALPDKIGGARAFVLPGRAGVLAIRGTDIVLAGSRGRLAAAMRLHDRRGGLTRAAFQRRLGPLRGPALLRLAALPGVLVPRGVATTPFAAAIRSASLAVRVASPGLQVRAHLATDPSRLRDADLPLAPGAAAPSPAPGVAPLSAGLRNLAQAIRVLDANRDRLRLPLLGGIESALGALDSVKGPLRTLGRIDVDALIGQLTGTTTFTLEPGGWAMRAQLTNGGALRTALNRLADVPDLAIRLSGLTDLNIAKAGADAYEIRTNGRTFLRAAVPGDTLVVTDDLNADAKAIARRAPQRTGRLGALAFHASAAAVEDQLVTRLGLPDLSRLVLGGFGPLDGSARASRAGIDLQAALTLSG